MNWNSLKKDHLFLSPVEHICTKTIFDIQEYDKLYENQNDLDHQVWKEFDLKYKTGFQFYDNLQTINLQKAVIALWFFRERSDIGQSLQINLAGKIIPFSYNGFLLTKSKNITFVEPKRKHIRYPCIQIDISEEKYKKIIEAIK